MKKPMNMPAMRVALKMEQERVGQMLVRKAQLENDLRAAKDREQVLIESNDNLRRDHALQSNALVIALRERDDWRDAFKLIMKLVK